MIHKRTLFILVFSLSVFFVSTPLPAQENNKEKEQPRTVKMQITPVAQVHPALKYTFLPGILDRKRGNAAQFYLRAVKSWPDFYEDEYSEKVDNWLDMPMDELPHDEVRKVATMQRSLREVRTAAIRDRCHWEMPLEEGFSMLLPGLGEFRDMANVLALKARLEVAEGNFDEAVRTLQTGFALGRDVGKGPTIIQGLVGMAIGGILLNEVEQFVQAPDSPNLYWALRTLPNPYVDMQKAIEQESIVLPRQFPLLKEIETTKLSVEQTRNLWNNILSFDFGEFAGVNSLATGIVMVLYPEAKRKLIEQGYTPEQVEAMPAGQVALIHQYRMYRNFMQEMHKWFHVPYWQAKPGLEQEKNKLRSHTRSLRDQIHNFPFVYILPALDRVYYNQARLQRRIEALCCVEAIRMYAAENDGKLPASLQEITQVPVPLDPVTGNPFLYSLENGTATLEGPAPNGQSVKDGFRYEITVRRKATEE